MNGPEVHGTTDDAGLVPAPRTDRDAPPRFSFLMTAYRTEDVIGRAIDSVLAQSSGEWELVVVDNGRSDALATVVEPYLADPRIRLLRQENRGAAGGTMAAAAAARGRFLVPLNSDDAVEPTFCVRMGAALAEAPDAAAVTCDAFRFTDPGEHRMTRTYLHSAGLEAPPDPRRSLRLVDVIDGPCPYYTAAIRRDVWDGLGGLASDTPLVDDLDFWLRALGEGHDIRTVPDVLGRFRIQSGSVSRPDENDRAEEFELQRETALIRAVDRSDDPECRAALDRVLRRQRYLRSIRRARRHFARGDATEARRHAEAAHAQRRTARSTGLVVALRVAPGTLRAVHPVKRWVQARLAETSRSRWFRRGAAPGRPERPVPAGGATFLALTNRHVESRQSGYDLRVANLCARLPGEVHLAVAPFQPARDARPGLALDGVFASTEELASLRSERARRGRHLRLSNRHFLSRSRPVAFAAARSRLQEIVRERSITHVVVFGGEIAELASGLRGVSVVLDVCDSATLTAERSRIDGSGPRALVRRARHALDVTRKRRTEAGFPREFDLVTAISDADAQVVGGRRAARAAGRVHTVPNGLDETYVRPLPEPGDRRGVVFWGNLAFGPNRDGLRWFVDEVYLPRLRDRGVELCVVGTGAPSWLVDLAATGSGIVLTGYVDDLPATVTRYPIMINPMRSGSGLKNKVLEAFGLGLAVVSTPLGVEALPAVEDGRDVVLAGRAEDVATAVLALLDDDARRERLRRAAHALVGERYRWEAVARVWRALFPTEGHPYAAPVPRPRTGMALPVSTRR